mgnify:CR=1 FL=1
MINETTEGQEAGEQREELFFKVIKAGNKILEILAALFIILMLLYGIPARSTDVRLSAEN